MIELEESKYQGIYILFLLSILFSGILSQIIFYRYDEPTIIPVAFSICGFFLAAGLWQVDKIKFLLNSYEVKIKYKITVGFDFSVVLFIAIASVIMFIKTLSGLEKWISISIVINVFTIIFIIVTARIAEIIRNKMTETLVECKNFNFNCNENILEFITKSEIKKIKIMDLENIFINTHINVLRQPKYLRWEIIESMWKKTFTKNPSLVFTLKSGEMYVYFLDEKNLYSALKIVNEFLEMNKKKEENK